MSTPPEKLAESLSDDYGAHLCQTGCGTKADVVLVQLATGECDIMCQPCLVAMMSAVIAEVAASVPDTADAAAVAADAARTALAAE